MPAAMAVSGPSLDANGVVSIHGPRLSFSLFVPFFCNVGRKGIESAQKAGHLPALFFTNQTAPSTHSAVADAMLNDMEDFSFRTPRRRCAELGYGWIEILRSPIALLAVTSVAPRTIFFE